MTAKTATKKVGLVVTTRLKGVFFGYAEMPTGKTPETIILKKARMCVSWSSDIRGVLGLASCGPSKSCKIGFAIPSLNVNDISSVMECSPEAVTAWERGVW